MVAGKVKEAMELQKSYHVSPKPETLKYFPSPSSEKAPQKTVFSRSFGVFFPRYSAQVQPRPPDVKELVRLVEELHERESHLKTQLLEQKLVNESTAIVPILEREILSKDTEIECSVKRIESLEVDNNRLRQEIESLQSKIEEERKESEKKVKAMEEEIFELKRMVSEQNRVESKVICNKTEESDDFSTSPRFQGLIDASAMSNLLNNLKKSVKLTDTTSNDLNQKLEIKDLKKEESASKGMHQSRCNKAEEISEISCSAISSVKCRAPRIPKPPPRPSSSKSHFSSLSLISDSTSATDNKVSSEKTYLTNVPEIPLSMPVVKVAPLPPPPPPLPWPAKAATEKKVKRVPEVAEFYHSLMRRDSRRDSGVGVCDVLASANARDMIGEIKNRSAHLLAIKTDVETQGDFIRFLIKEVKNAAFTCIEDVVTFVKWLDDELSYLVDERAVLKHFDWPENKADALRDAAFGYCDLKKLESEASSFRDEIRQPYGTALKKMQALLEKLEHGVHNLSRMRDSSTKKYKEFNIPTEWMLETGFVSQIKLASAKLAMKYMRRVSAELEAACGNPEEEELMLQGVKFAFRVHQFVGGFDTETIQAFEELRNKARSCHIQCQNEHQKLVCRSMPC